MDVKKSIICILIRIRRIFVSHKDGYDQASTLRDSDGVLRCLDCFPSLCQPLSILDPRAGSSSNFSGDLFCSRRRGVVYFLDHGLHVFRSCLNKYKY